MNKKSLLIILVLLALVAVVLHGFVLSDEEPTGMEGLTQEQIDQKQMQMEAMQEQMSIMLQGAPNQPSKQSQ